MSVFRLFTIHLNLKSKMHLNFITLIYLLITSVMIAQSWIELKPSKLQMWVIYSITVQIHLVMLVLPKGILLEVLLRK